MHGVWKFGIMANIELDLNPLWQMNISGGYLLQMQAYWKSVSSAFETCTRRCGRAVLRMQDRFATNIIISI